MVEDSDEERRILLRDSFRSVLNELELAGRSFEIKRNSIRKTEARSTWVTAQNVQIIFEGTPDSNNINRSNKQGEEIITIKTSSINFN